ncbi:MAG: hypothetical protein HYZ91_00725 [Candidatus Omnitrophica bacterium]|nr:hypothetical protein [Candidatus Omnitrophota bacterium]
MRDPCGIGVAGRLVMGGALMSAGCLALPARQDRSGQSTMMINAPSDARWTSTTREAVSSPAHHRVLEQARAQTITGEVIDVSCFLQLGKRGEAHASCGQKCVRNGQPIGVLTDRGQVYLILPEEHHPRRDGQVSITDRFAELMAKRVRVSGMATTSYGARALFVRSLPTEQAQ